MEQFFSLLNNAFVFWFVAGTVLVLLEVSLLPGVGFLFAGLGAITIGSLLSFGIISSEISVVTQLAYFFVFTTVWAIALWYPLKKSLNKPAKDKYSDIIGAVALVDCKHGLEKDKIGFVKWSGVKMRASIIESSHAKNIKDSEQVWVHSIVNGVLLVDVKKPNLN